MKDGELLFAKATANTEQKLLRERIRDIMTSVEPLGLLTEFVMKLRRELRKTLLEEKDGAAREKILEKFNEDLHDFHVAYLEGLVIMHQYDEYSELKALPFLSFNVRHKELFQHIDNDYGNFFVNSGSFRGLDMDFKDFLRSGWDVLVYLVPEPLHTLYDMVEITEDTLLEETDWDGTKEKRGKEVIRRNGECGGKVLTFVHVEEENNEEEENVVVMHFYAVSIDGKEMRHYRHERRW